MWRAARTKYAEARLAVLQTALMKASAEEGFRWTLVFHHQVKEAEAFAADRRVRKPGATEATVVCRCRPGDC
ncbi:hypothetical protein AMK33_38440 [Streptomyces sp. CB02400]|nr:hypothetical protein AMK33_38440 [Streptomyces sp. CB02400]